MSALWHAAKGEVSARVLQSGHTAPKDSTIMIQVDEQLMRESIRQRSIGVSAFSSPGPCWFHSFCYTDHYI